MAYHFGDFTLDEQLFQLRRADQEVPLRPQAFDALLILVQANDRVVSKEELISIVSSALLVSYALYTYFAYRSHAMMATVPFAVYGIFRYLYLIYDRNDTRSTAAILTEDPGMIFAGVSWVVIALLMLYVVD